jgi:methylmalonyl-CoA mutase N-terminal domain/subunit
MEFFENIAQQRAARRLWAHIMRDQYGATNPKSMQLRYLAGGGSGTSLTHAYPLLNIARLAFHCLMQVLGGTQVVGLQSYDEAYDIPSEQAAQLSLLTQAVVAYELGVTDVVDPLGGSYHVETLTNQIEERIKEYMAMIKTWGGPVAAIESGQVQEEIAVQSYKWMRRVEDGTRPMVGVNIFKPENESEVEPIRTFNADPTVLGRQKSNLAKVKAERDSRAVSESLNRLQGAAASGVNTMPFMIDAVRQYATVGEIVDSLAKVYGRFQEPAF